MTMEITLLLISGLITASVILIWHGLFRMQSVPSIRERFAQYVGTTPTIEELERRQPLSERIIKPTFRQLLQRLGRLSPAKNLESIERKLIIAGQPGNLSALDFLGLKILFGVLISGLAIAYFFSQNDLQKAMLGGLGGLVIGMYLPNMWLNNRIKQRKNFIVRALPNALDMLTICVDAGLGFDAALMKVAEEWDNPLSQEFARALSEIRMGVRRADALRHLAERTDVPEVHAFVAVLIQADRLGVSISDVLHAQSDQMRMRRRQWAEEQARKAPLKMLFPLVLFIFPALFAVILGPAVPRILEALSVMK